MRAVAAVVVLSVATIPAFAQPPAAPQPPSKSAATCPDCGVVNSIRTVTKTPRQDPNADDKPSGLTATIPLGGGGKPQVGSSTKYGREASVATTTWEVIVRMDDGRFRVLTLDEEPEVVKGDKVKVVQNRVVPRGN